MTEFEPELPGLFNWVTALSREDNKRILNQLTQTNPVVLHRQIEQLLQTHPLAKWVDECLVYAPGEKTKVGKGERGRDEDGFFRFKHQESLLYPNYLLYCHSTGQRPVSQRSFSPDLKDLLHNQLDLSQVSRLERASKGRFFEGIRLRDESLDAEGCLSPMEAAREKMLGDASLDEGIQTTLL